jgi:hypothetical protein
MWIRETYQDRYRSRLRRPRQPCWRMFNFLISIEEIRSVETRREHEIEPCVNFFFSSILAFECLRLKNL